MNMRKIICVLLCVVFLGAMISANGNTSPETSAGELFSSYLDVPEITLSEIEAIEKLQNKTDAFIINMPYNTELFTDENGEMRGYLVLLCDWLTELFGIKFQPQIEELDIILKKLDAGESVFANIVVTDPRRQSYFMTDPIVQRSLKIMRLEDGGVIARTETPRYAFLKGSMIKELFEDILDPGSYSVLVAESYEEAYLMMRSGEADAFIGHNTMEIAFDAYGKVSAEDFLPLTFVPAGIAAGNSGLEPVISVITKAVRGGAYSHLTELYRQGYQEYRNYRFASRLTEEEKLYLEKNPVIPYASQYMSYPVSFYNINEKRWNGAVFEVVSEIEKLTGNYFKLVSDINTELPELMSMLENGTAYFMPNLIQTPERRDRFLWTETLYITDRYALLSKQDYHNIELNDIPFEKVGYARGSAFADMFRRWFPNAVNAVEYSNTDEAFAALDRGEINLVMSAQSRLASLTNYYEYSDYKANYLFKDQFQASFGVNKDQPLLVSIIDKALIFIDVDRIIEQWQTRTYDYQARKMRDRQIWIISVSVLIVTALTLLLCILLTAYIKAKRRGRIITSQAAELNSANERIDAIIQNIPGMVFRHIYNPPDFTCLFVSEGCRELTGYEAKDMLDGTVKFFDFIHADDREPVVKLSAETLEAGLPYENTVRIITKGGEEKWVWERSRVIAKNPDGTPHIIEGYHTDVTERMRLEAAELEQKRMSEKTEAIISNLTGMVFQCLNSYPDYPLTFVSSGSKDILGYTSEELVGLENKYMTMLHPDDFDDYSKNVMETLEAGLPFENTHRLIMPDGKIKWVTETCIVTGKNPDGSFATIDGYVCDVTKQKKLEEESLNHKAEIINMHDNIKVILESIPVGIRVARQGDGRLLYANRAVMEIFGWEAASEEELQRHSVFEFMPEIQPNGKRTADMAEEFNSKDKSAMDFQCVRLNGETFTARIYSVNINYMGSPSSLAVLEDMTEKNRMLEAARRADIAEASSLAKSQFLATMSHEIRTPMNSIMGFAELASDSDNMRQTKDYLNKITDSTEWLLRIINDILDVSKIEAGRMELEKAPFNLYEVFTRCQSVILPPVKEKGLDLRIYAEPLEGRQLVGDPVRLYQALMNLLSNAVKFTSGGIIKFAALVKEVYEDGALVYFEVSDSGIGMTPEQVEKIFEPFVQADSSTTRNYGGTGLGLAIVKNIVELMGGKLAVESAPSEGSKFSFEILFDTVESNAEPARQSDLIFTERPNFDALILICDDNPMNREVICGHLSRIGIRTETAENGREGVEIVRGRIERGEKPFDLIFMDMFMPVMDGIEAAEKISEFNTGAPIVAMTANIMSGELEKYKKHGMPDCLGKPFTSHELWRVLLKYLEPVSSEPIGGFDSADEETRRRLEINFVKNNRTICEEILNAAAAGDMKLAHRLAHTLKGNAGPIGKNELKNAAYELEHLPKDGTDAVWDNKMKL
ncbi:MAG: PAS domain-containing protein, partial [Oscillospiraceae bacterium]|nr:PAS domain-containing protein [Oscillospiraceae bacterium]